MKTKFSITFCIALAGTMLLTGCAPKFWNGKKPKEKVEKVTYEACECLYETFKEEDFDVDRLLKIYDEFKADVEADMDREAFAKKYADELQIIMAMQKYVETSDAPACITALQTKMDQLSETEGEGLRDLIRQHFEEKCKMNLFIDN